MVLLWVVAAQPLSGPIVETTDRLKTKGRLKNREGTRVVLRGQELKNGVDRLAKPVRRGDDAATSRVLSPPPQPQHHPICTTRRALRKGARVSVEANGSPGGFVDALEWSPGLASLTGKLKLRKFTIL